jgi:hypothetical protein
MILGHPVTWKRIVSVRCVVRIFIHELVPNAVYFVTGSDRYAPYPRAFPLITDDAFYCRGEEIYDQVSLYVIYILSDTLEGNQRIHTWTQDIRRGIDSPSRGDLHTWANCYYSMPVQR